jgi:hypothetical protein
VAVSGFCVFHGGGYRCELCAELKEEAGGSDLVEVMHAPYRNREGQHVCWQHFYANMNRTCRALRREVVMLGAVITNLPALLGLTHEEFGEYYMVHDKGLSIQLEHSCKLLRRPDMLFCFPHGAVLIEIDENRHVGRTELSEIEHLAVIRQWAEENFGLDNMYVLRINPDGCNKMFCKRLLGNGEEVWQPTEHFEAKLATAAKILVPWIQRALKGGKGDPFAGHLQRCRVEKLFF